MSDRRSKGLPAADWPPADRSAWDRAQLPPDFLDPTIGYAMRWKPSTRKVTEGGYGRWLAWLDEIGALQMDSSPGSRPTRERVGEYLQHLQDRGLADYTIAGRLQNLADMLKAIAPNGDWSFIQRGSSRLYSAAKPAKDIDARLRPAHEVFQLGLDLMHAAEHDRFRTDEDRATLFRDGLLIALLIRCPFRISNMAGIHLGQHLVRRGAEWWLRFEPEETKGGRPIECSWPQDLVASLERYVAKHRPVLMEGPPDGDMTALWVSRNATAMSPMVLAYRVNTRTEETFGTPINPHSFRDIAATTIATENPDKVASIAPVLSHSSLKTSGRHYNRAKMLTASQKYQALLIKRRRTTNSISLLKGDDVQGDTVLCPVSRHTQPRTRAAPLRPIT